MYLFVSLLLEITGWEQDEMPSEAVFLHEES